VPYNPIVSDARSRGQALARCRAAVLVLVLAAVRAQGEETAPPVAGPGPNAIREAAVAGEARDTLSGAAAGQGTAMFVWGVTAAVSGGYAGWAFSGRTHGASVLTYLAVAGFVGGLTGLGAAAWRQHDLNGLILHLDQDLARPAGSDPVLAPATCALVGTELHRMHRELHRESEGALRAGCVMPVLLSGIGLYGVLLQDSGGQQLAGVTLGGAMVIGVPSMLTYWGLSGRLERMDGLMQRWSNTFESGGATTR